MSSIANAVLRSQDDPYGVKQRQREKDAELLRKTKEEEKDKEPGQAEASKASTGEE